MTHYGSAITVSPSTITIHVYIVNYLVNESFGSGIGTLAFSPSVLVLILHLRRLSYRSVFPSNYSGEYSQTHAVIGPGMN